MNDARVLGHVRRYPGLSSYEIARALGLTYGNRYVNKPAVEQALMRLFYAGDVTFSYVPWPAPGGRKRIWRYTMKIRPRDYNGHTPADLLPEVQAIVDRNTDYCLTVMASLQRKVFELGETLGYSRAQVLELAGMDEGSPGLFPVKSA